MPVGQTPGEGEDAGGRPGNGQAVELPVRQERTELLVVTQSAAGLAEQVHRRVPPAADQQRIAGQRLDVTDGAIAEPADQGMGDPLGTLGAGDNGTGSDGDAESLQFGLPVRGPFRSGIDDGTDPDTGMVQVDRGVVGAVVGGEHHHVAARQHPVAVQVGAGRTGEHDARPVVVREHHGPLMSPGCDHDRLRAEPPDPLPGKIFRCMGAEVIGAPLEGEYEAVVVAAERGGALQVQYVGVAGEFGGRGTNPLVRGNTVEGLGGGQQ